MERPRILIDVRRPDEFSLGHLEGALNIPYETIAAAIREVKGADIESDVVLYCRSGRRSAIAKTTLEDLGFKWVTDLKTVEQAQIVLNIPLANETSSAAATTKSQLDF